VSSRRCINSRCQDAKTRLVDAAKTGLRGFVNASRSDVGYHYNWLHVSQTGMVCCT
jgi:hypothetical protein